MRVAGFGFRDGVTPDAMMQALAAAGGAQGLTAIATAADKADHPVIAALAARLALPLQAIPLAVLTLQPATASSGVPARYGHRSVAEASALAGCGPGARLISGRHVSPDRTATAAIAERIPE